MKIQSENTNITVGKALLTEQKVVEHSNDTVPKELETEKAQSTQPVKEVIADALKASGFSASDENIKLALLLMQNRLPVNRETLMIIKQSTLIFGAENEIKALFMALNALRPTDKNINMLNSYISGDICLLENIETVANLITQIDDPKLKAELFKTVLGKADFAAITEITASPVGEQTATEPSKLISTDTDLTPIPALGFESAKPELLPLQALESAIAELSQEISAVLSNKENIPETIFQNLESAVKEAVGKLSNDFPAVFQREEIIKNVVQELKNNYSPEKLIELVSTTPETMQQKTPFQQLIENTLSRIVTQSEAETIANLAEKIPFEIKNGKEAPAELTGKRAATELVKTLSFNPKDTTNKQLNEYLNTLKETLDSVRQTLLRSPQTETVQKLLMEVAALNENLNFFTHVKNNLFLQIPIYINEHFSNAELYVMKDRKAHGQKSGSQSALIAINTSSLGRFEAYVQKDNRSINIQFRIETEPVEQLVKANIGKLVTALEQYSYYVDGCMYKRLTEAFTLEDTVKNDGLFGSEGSFEKTTAFDMKG